MQPPRPDEYPFNQPLPPASRPRIPARRPSPPVKRKYTPPREQDVVLDVIQEDTPWRPPTAPPKAKRRLAPHVFAEEADDCLDLSPYSYSVPKYLCNNGDWCNTPTGGIARDTMVRTYCCSGCHVQRCEFCAHAILRTRDHTRCWSYYTPDRSYYEALEHECLCEDKNERWRKWCTRFTKY